MTLYCSRKKRTHRPGIALLAVILVIFIVMAGTGITVWKWQDEKKSPTNSAGASLSSASIRNPRVVATFPLEAADKVAGTSHGLLVSNNYEVIAFNIANPVQLQEVSRWPAEHAGVDALAFSEVVGYAIDGDGLMTINFSNPQKPTLVRETDDSPLTSYDMTAEKNLLFNADAELSVVDVSQVGNPKVVGTPNYTDYLVNVASSGRYVFGLDLYRGLLVMNVENPEVPVIVGQFNTPAMKDIIDVGVSGSTVIVLVKDEAWFINVANPSKPEYLGKVSELHDPKQIFTAGHYAFVADGQQGLKIIDLNDPAQPRVDATVSTSAPAEGVAVVGRYAYVAHSAGIDVIELGATAIGEASITPNPACAREISGFQYDTYNDRCNAFIIHDCAESVGISSAQACRDLHPVRPTITHIDSDGDKLTDFHEKLFQTDPSQKDTDGDGFDDGTEAYGFFLPIGNGKMTTQYFIEYCRRSMDLGSPSGDASWIDYPKQEKEIICSQAAALWKNDQPPLEIIRHEATGLRLTNNPDACRTVYPDDGKDMDARSKTLHCNNSSYMILYWFLNPLQSADTLDAGIGLSTGT